MCSVLFAFTIGVVIIFHCCKITDANLESFRSSVVARARNSYVYARNSIFSYHNTETEEDIEKDEPKKHLLLRRP
ncbi:hypothetical protein WR25_05030 [Diploscapter pachys]|uniref:Uncharacterized protein n=1 Tax=Diploscapter pachys TaxID=2018661 RepID=A0A2A2J586_9BILA|nr:hypothetical protein WR25_05030 [Diploscapter pachys]